MKKKIFLKYLSKNYGQKGVWRIYERSKEFFGVVGKHKIWGGCIFHQAKMNNNMNSNYLGFTFGMLKNVGMFLVRQILKLDLALGMP